MCRSCFLTLVDQFLYIFSTLSSASVCLLNLDGCHVNAFLGRTGQIHFLRFHATMDAHEEAVTAIAAHVRQFYGRKEPYRIYHGSTNSTRQSTIQRDKMIDTSNLSRVLWIDTERMTALVEPNVPMDSLVHATLQHGLIPPVVMEFPGITVGGGFAGTSGESSSFKYDLRPNTSRNAYRIAGADQFFPLKIWLF